jgi:hypothetical protein
LNTKNLQKKDAALLVFCEFFGLSPRFFSCCGAPALEDRAPITGRYRMLGLTLKPFVAVRLQMLLMSFIAIQAISPSTIAQTLSVPSPSPSGTYTGTFTRITIGPNGTVSGTNLSAVDQNANNTNLISVTGANAILTLSGSSTVTGSNSIVGVNATNGGNVRLNDGLTLTITVQSGTGLAANASTLTIGSGVTLTENFNATQDIGVNATNGAILTIGKASASPSTLIFNFSNAGSTGLNVDASTLILTNTTVDLKEPGGNTSIGISATNTANVTINGGAVSLVAINDKSIGVLANNSNVSIDGTAITLAPAPNGGNLTNNDVGVYATKSAMVGITGGSVSVTVGNTIDFGVIASNSADITMTGTSVNLMTAGQNDVGVAAAPFSGTPSAAAAGKVTMIGGSVNVTQTSPNGNNNIGVLASGTGATATLEGTRVTVNGSGTGSAPDIGVQADGSGALLTAESTAPGNSIITVTGNNDIGARAQNSGIINASNDTAIAVDGNNPTGVQLNNTGTINMVGEALLRQVRPVLSARLSWCPALPAARTSGHSMERW